MSIEDVIRAWKTDEDSHEASSIANPIGEELTDQALQEINGGVCTIAYLTCANVQTCTNGITFCIEAPTA